MTVENIAINIINQLAVLIDPKIDDLSRKVSKNLG
jgi:hypothetical protein